MTEVVITRPITGDIAASADVTLSTKGGSVTAILKKPLRDRLGDYGAALAGAAIEFATGESVLILANAAADHGQVRVRKTGVNRFEIEIENGDALEVDAIDAAFLHIKRSQFEKGKLALSGPMTADEWKRKADAEMDEARRIIATVETS